MAASGSVAVSVSGGGSLVDRLPYWGFVAPDAVLTRAGEFLFCGRVRLKSVDAEDPEELDRCNQMWQRLLGMLEPPHRFQIAFERRPAQVPEIGSNADTGLAQLVQGKRRSFVQRTLSDLDVWLILCYQPGLQARVGDMESTWYIEYLRTWFTKFQTNPPVTYLIRNVVEKALDEARTHWDLLRSVVEDHTKIEPVAGREFASMLHRVVNYRSGGWVLDDKLPAYGLSVRIADSTLGFERTHALVDHRVVGLYSLSLPPRKVSANALAKLYAQPWEFNSLIEWRPMWQEDVKSKIRAVQKHHNNMRWSMFSAMNETEGTDMAVEDVSAAGAIVSLDRAMTELVNDGVSYGEMALSFAVVSDTVDDLDRKGAEINRAFVELDGKMVRERFGQAAVWFQRLVGATRDTLPRPLLVSSGQVACLAPIFGSSPGYPTCDHLKAPPLTTFKTRWATAYRYDLFGGGDVGHTLVLGATGSGKSFLLNFFLLQSLQYRPKIVIIDLGGSYRWITKLVKGSYLSLQIEGDDSQSASVGKGLRPFQLPPNDRTYSFLVGWVSCLLDIGGYEVTADDANEIRERVVSIYSFDPVDRTLSALVTSLPDRMWPALARWVGDGQWAQTFDGPPPTGDELEDALDSDWQVVDLAGAVNFPDWCRAALFFLLERLRLAMDDDAEQGRLKLMVADECWKFLQDPAVCLYLTEAAKTWRKRNGVLVIATQSAEDLQQSQQTRALLQSLPTKLFLSNPAFPPAAGQVFDLTDAEYNTVRELLPKKEIFLHRAGGERAIVTLDVDDESYWLYTSAASEAAKRAQMIEQYGLVGGIQRLASGLDEDAPADDVRTLVG